MKKFLIVLLALLTQAAWAQNLSDTKKLEATARIWGFLKYYHPQVAMGKFNWDQKLIDILPEVEKAQTREALSEVYIKWIDVLGEVPVCKKCGKPSKDELFEKNFSMAWMQDRNILTDALIAKLKYIEANRHQGVGHYAGFGETDNILIRNEPEYKDFDYPNCHYRLLSLFRHWNIAEYFCPDKYLTDQKWDEVLTEMIPKFRDAKDAQAYHLAMLELVAKLDDSHATLVTDHTNEYFGNYTAPFRFTIIDGKAVVNGFHDEAKTKQDDVRIGDAMTHVNGVAIADILAKVDAYISGSNPEGKRRNALFAVFNGATDKASVTFERDGKTATKEISRYLRKDLTAPEKSAEKYKILEGTIGYVNLGNVEIDDVPEMMQKLMGCKAIIFDLRNSARSTLYILGSYLLPKPRNFVRFAKPDINYPGKYIWNDKYFVGPEKNKDHYKGKLLVIVNEFTQSHGEFTAMSLQVADNVTTIGSQTAGSDGNVSFFEFPGGFKTRITGLGVNYPDGTETQRVGIKVDIKIRPTIAGIRAGNDEVLDKAIELANQ